MIDTVFSLIKLPLPEAKSGGWVPYPLFRGETSSLKHMGCHVSVLSAGFCPHPPHAHDEEELLIVLAGAAEIILAAAEDDAHPRIMTLEPGQFSYYPAWQHHTLRNPFSSAVTYLMFKWRNETGEGGMAPQVFDYRQHLHMEDGRPFSPRLVFEGSTRWLRRLHCHLTHLQPGAGYEAHADPHDVALLTLSGKLQINSAVLEPYGAGYFSAGQMHDMKNIGSEPAQYLVFEFDNRG
jgi:mannose-6-phosphate isomerase-like protein (cupin superfamily)